jgi:hypothetical protein
MIATPAGTVNPGIRSRNTGARQLAALGVQRGLYGLEPAGTLGSMCEVRPALMETAVSAVPSMETAVSAAPPVETAVSAVPPVETAVSAVPPMETAVSAAPPMETAVSAVPRPPFSKIFPRYARAI